MSTPTLEDGSESGLLERFIAQAVVDEYAQVAPTEPGAPGRRRHLLAVPAMVVIGLLIIVAVISARAADEQRQSTRDALVERVSTLTASVAERQATVDGQTSTVDGLRADVLGGVTPEQEAELSRLAQLAAVTELSGPGVTVTIDDAPGAEAGSLNRVLDRDLQDIVNTLWRTGAVGIAVNEERLTGTTAIRGAGEAILVNYRPIGRPYVISAVGTSTSGQTDSGLDALLATLADDYGLVSTTSTGDVALPAGVVRDPRFAQTDQEGAGS